MKLGDYSVRPVRKDDNAMLAKLIRNTLEEFKANKPGTVYFDKETDALFELFDRTPGSAYYILEKKDELLGAAGYFPTSGLPDKTCELVKMYLFPAARGKGLGYGLLQHVMQQAKLAGYDNMYLETMPELTLAIELYKKAGFHFIEGAVGSSGHFGCDIHMSRAI